MIQLGGFLGYLAADFLLVVFGTGIETGKRGAPILATVQNKLLCEKK